MEMGAERGSVLGFLIIWRKFFYAVIADLYDVQPAPKQKALVL